MVVFQANHKLKPFQGARICFLGFPEEEQKHMVEVLIQNGGTQTDHEDSQCTHMVMLSVLYWITFMSMYLVLCSAIIIMITTTTMYFSVSILIKYVNVLFDFCCCYDC